MSNRVIDKLVAEKVLRWIKPPATSILKPMWVEPVGIVHEQLPRFSTNIQDAWRIVDIFGYAFQLTESSGEWKCTFVYKINDRGVGQYISSDREGTAPLAICMAALKAVGVEVDA
jgi:hypothetical protein